MGSNLIYYLWSRALACRFLRTDSQDGEILTEELEVEEPDGTGADLGEKAQDVEAQDENPLEEAQDAAQLQGKVQEEEDVFNDELP